ncbi:MAG: LVIVD repeat-containing protein [Candidatus Heimdallarchaeota archaeon]
MGKRTQLLQTIFIIILFVATFSTFDSSYIPSEGSLSKAEYNTTISESSGENLELLGQYDENIGRPRTMFIEENFLYIKSQSAGLIKMDISDSTRPSILGINKLATNWYGDQFCIQDSILYLNDGFYIKVVNITDFNNLVELVGIEGINNDLFYYCNDVKVYGNLLITNWESGFICSYDISDPTNIVLLNLLNLTHLDYRLDDFEYFNDTLYIISNQEGNSTLVIYDVSNFSNPVYLGNYTSPYDTNSEKIIVDESNAYVINDHELLVYNITNLTTPTLLDSITLTQGYEDLCELKLVEDSLYITSKSTIITLDVSNNTDIQIIDIDIERSYLQGLTLKDNYAFIINSEYSELIIYDITVPNNPQKVNTYYFGGYSHNVCVDKKITYVANGYNGTQIIDICDPKKPQIIGRYSDEDCIDNVQVVGSILYASSIYNCLKLIDISDPSNPILLSEYRSKTSHTNYANIKIAKNKVFLIHGYNGLEIVDVSDSTKPTFLGNYTDSFIMDIEIMNNYVIAEAYEKEPTIIILDVSNPTNIQKISTLDYDGHYVKEISVAGNRAYLLSNEEDMSMSISIVNIGNPKNPKILSRAKINFVSVNDFEASGDYLYLSNLHDGLIVLKNNFDRLRYIGKSVEGDISPRNIDVGSGYVCLACGYEGLAIFKAFTSVKISTIIFSSAIVIAVVIIAVLVVQIIRTKRR